jgi:hypothetical protein
LFNRSKRVFREEIDVKFLSIIFWSNKSTLDLGLNFDDFWFPYQCDDDQIKIRKIETVTQTL